MRLGREAKTTMTTWTPVCRPMEDERRFAFRVDRIARRRTRGRERK